MTVAIRDSFCRKNWCVPIDYLDKRIKMWDLYDRYGGDAPIWRKKQSFSLFLDVYTKKWVVVFRPYELLFIYKHKKSIVYEWPDIKKQGKTKVKKNNIISFEDTFKIPRPPLKPQELIYQKVKDPRANCVITPKKYSANSPEHVRNFKKYYLKRDS